jgi:hypothetical protein
MLALLAALSTSYVVVPPPVEAASKVADTVEIAAAAPVIFYMNFDGGTYRPGSEDARTNSSSIAHETGTIAPWSAPQSSHDAVVDCMESMMSRWNVQIVTEDPGDVAHYELVIGGRPTDLGFDGNYGGVAPFRSDCSVIPNAVTYTFAEVIGNNPQAVCQVAAQEVAHSLGLDHEYLCSDPMSYLTGCGAKTFQDVDARCGEYGERDCYCGGETQNSVEMFDERLGAAGEGNSAPEVTITSPADGATLAPGFAVNADVADNFGVEKVELRVDGQLAGVAEGTPVTFQTGATMATGAHTIELRAYDAAGATTTATINVTVAREGEDPGTGGTTGGDDAGDDEDTAAAAGCNAGGGEGTANAAIILLLLAFLISRPVLRRSPARRRLRR